MFRSATDLRSSLRDHWKKYIQFFYQHFVGNNGKLFTTFLAVQKLPDDNLFAIAYAAEILDRDSQTGAVFPVQEMLENLINY